MQDSVDAITNAQIVFERFHMNIGGALDDRLANDLIDKLDDRSLRIVRGQVGASLGVLQDLERAISFKNLVERFGADAIKSFHRAQKLSTRHEHPFGRLFQELRHELAADRIEKIVGCEHDRSFLHLHRENVMLKNKTTWQDRQCLPVYRLRINRDNRHTKEISDHAEKSLLVHFSRIEHLSCPGTAVEILGELRRFLPRRNTAGEQEIDD